MNKLGINLWNWAPGLSDACCGLPTKAAEMGFTALELPMTQPAVSPTLRDEVCGSGLESFAVRRHGGRARSFEL